MLQCTQIKTSKLKTMIQQGPKPAAPTYPAKPTCVSPKKSPTKLPTPKGNWLVSFEGKFFIMTPKGTYCPWKDTVITGEPMDSRTYDQLHYEIGWGMMSSLTAKEERSACIIAHHLEKDPLYGLSDEQRSAIAILKEEAATEKIPVKELLRRKKIRAEREGKRDLKKAANAAQEKKPLERIKTESKEDGRTYYSMSSIPGFLNLGHVIDMKERYAPKTKVS
jgi:hypothetical protein